MVFVDVFNPEVINYEFENNWAPFEAPESWICGRFIVAVFVKAGTEKIVC